MHTIILQSCIHSCLSCDSPRNYIRAKLITWSSSYCSWLDDSSWCSQYWFLSTINRLNAALLPHTHTRSGSIMRQKVHICCFMYLVGCTFTLQRAHVAGATVCCGVGKCGPMRWSISGPFTWQHLQEALRKQWVHSVNNHQPHFITPSSLLQLFRSFSSLYNYLKLHQQCIQNNMC